jgi:DNA polymerase-3 subunit delta
MSIKSFFEEMEKGLKRPAYLLYSEDEYLLKEALYSVKKSVPDPERDFLFHAYDMEPADSAPPLEQIIDVLVTVPFFSGGRKAVAVESAQKINAAGLKALAVYLEKPSPDSVLILLHAGTPKKALRDALHRARAIPMSIRERDLPLWVMEKAREKGIRLDTDAVQYLIGAVGPDAGLLSSEIEKLAMFGKQALGRQDVVEIVRGSGDFDVFDLTKALKAGDADRVFRVYSVISETQEPYALLGALNWHYGKSEESGEKRARIFELLNEADTMVKSSGKAFPMEYLLVKLLRLSGPVQKSAGKPRLAD